MPIPLTGPDGGSPEAPVALELIQEMVTSYSQNLRQQSGEILAKQFPGQGKMQSNCAWVGWAELQLLMSQNQGTGIRIYFGQHTKRSCPTGSPNFEGLLSVILVATQAPDFEVTSENSYDQLTQSNDLKKASTVCVAGNFMGLGDDQFPICNPKCPLSGRMKIDIS